MEEPIVVTSVTDRKDTESMQAMPDTITMEPGWPDCRKKGGEPGCAMPKTEIASPGREEL